MSDHIYGYKHVYRIYWIGRVGAVLNIIVDADDPEMYVFYFSRVFPFETITPMRPVVHWQFVT